MYLVVQDTGIRNAQNLRHVTPLLCRFLESVWMNLLKRKNRTENDVGTLWWMQFEISYKLKAHQYEELLCLKKIWFPCLFDSSEIEVTQIIKLSCTLYFFIFFFVVPFKRLLGNWTPLQIEMEESLLILDIFFM